MTDLNLVINEIQSFPMLFNVLLTYVIISYLVLRENSTFAYMLLSLYSFLCVIFTASFLTDCKDMWIIVIFFIFTMFLSIVEIFKRTRKSK